MIDIHSDVLAFHQKFAPTTIGGPTPTLPTPELLDLRKELITEEYEELLEAIAAGDLVEMADAAADLTYVVTGLMIACGIDIRPVWREVQRSNMAKEGGPTRADGKILKPAGWLPPDITRVLYNQGLQPGVAPGKPAFLNRPAAAEAPAATPAFAPEALRAFDAAPEAGFTVTDASPESAPEGEPEAAPTPAPAPSKTTKRSASKMTAKELAAASEE